MTLLEAITHADKVVDGVRGHTHRQLGRWLRELQAWRELRYPLALTKVLCQAWGIKVIEMTEDGEDSENCCYSAGCDTIFIGRYEDPDLLTISFFHELGHCANGQDKSLPPFKEWPYDHYNEAMAWKRGMEIAEEQGLTLAPHAHVWAVEQLSTYFKDDHPEKTPMKFLPQAIEDSDLRPRRT